jgi:hypothetical protein
MELDKRKCECICDFICKSGEEASARAATKQTEPEIGADSARSATTTNKIINLRVSSGK